jgi:hypothetical protein
MIQAGSDYLAPYSKVDAQITAHLARYFWWLWHAPFAVDIAACAETNS